MPVDLAIRAVYDGRRFADRLRVRYAALHATEVPGALTVTIVLIQERILPLPMVREISLSVLPFVAALFCTGRDAGLHRRHYRTGRSVATLGATQRTGERGVGGGHHCDC